MPRARPRVVGDFGLFSDRKAGICALPCEVIGRIKLGQRSPDATRA